MPNVPCDAWRLNVASAAPMPANPESAKVGTPAVLHLLDRQPRAPLDAPRGRHDVGVMIDRCRAVDQRRNRGRLDRRLDRLVNILMKLRRGIELPQLEVEDARADGERALLPLRRGDVADRSLMQQPRARD